MFAYKELNKLINSEILLEGNFVAKYIRLPPDDLQAQSNLKLRKTMPKNMFLGKFQWCSSVIFSPLSQPCFAHYEILNLIKILIKNCGLQVHELPPEKLKHREIVHIDIANDPVTSADYKADEDPTKFKSEKTGRGPLVGQWMDKV